MSLLVFAGRWAWLALIVASLLIGVYLLRTLHEFEDSAQLASDVSELREYQEELLQALIMSFMLGLPTDSSPDEIVDEANAGAVALIDRLDRHWFVCEDGCTSAEHQQGHAHSAAASIEAVVRDLRALASFTSEDTSGYIEALADSPALAEAISGDASPFVGDGGLELTLLAARYAALSASVTANLDRAINELGEEGEAAASRVRQVGRLGIGILLVGGVLSTSGFAWAGRRARKLTWDMERARELDGLKSEFVGLASHELRTPLAGIYGFSELLLSDEELSEHARGWAARINDESRRLSEIVNNLLDISRIEAGETTVELEVVRLDDVVDTVVKLFEESPDHEIVRSGTFEAMVLADRARLVQVFSNVVDNAIKYSPSGGTVRIEGQVDADDVRVCVVDEGLGIPADQLPLIFERFHRVRRAETENIRSTGLGLYLVRELLNLMDGTITAESELDAGTTISVRLPRYVSEVREASAAA